MDRQDWLDSGKGKEEDGEGEKEGREIGVTEWNNSLYNPGKIASRFLG